MGTPILARAALVVGATDGEGGDTYAFLAPYGVYVGDIATATGITAATADTTLEDDVLTSVKALLRSELMLTAKVLVYDAVANVSYIKTLHYSADKTTFKTDIKGKLWPVGAGAGQPITGTMKSVRVKSRQ
ncbi:hypothetical protein [Nostoc sp.]